MSVNETNLTTVGVPKATFEALYSNVLRAALELKIRVVLCRQACEAFTKRDEILDRILALVRDTFTHLYRLSPRAESGDLEDDLEAEADGGDELIGSVAERELRKLAAELKARGAL
jgi:hypothetical protein